MENTKAAVRDIHMGNVPGDRNQEFMTWPGTFLKDIMEESLPQGKTRELFREWRFMNAWMRVCTCVSMQGVER